MLQIENKVECNSKSNNKNKNKIDSHSSVVSCMETKMNIQRSTIAIEIPKKRPTQQQQHYIQPKQIIWNFFTPNTRPLHLIITFTALYVHIRRKRFIGKSPRQQPATINYALVHRRYTKTGKRKTHNAHRADYSPFPTLCCTHRLGSFTRNRRLKRNPS